MRFAIGINKDSFDLPMKLSVFPQKIDSIYLIHSQVLRIFERFYK